MLRMSVSPCGFPGCRDRFPDQTTENPALEGFHNLRTSFSPDPSGRVKASVVRLAVISDIHGNGVGLEAVLDDLAREPLDGFVCLGDVSEGGPQPVECADRIR